MVEWMYPATLVRVVDGDTLRLRVDLGFRLSFEDNFRIADIDAPEVRGEERPQGLLAKAWSENWLAGKKLVIKSHKHGKYRWVVEVCADGEDFGEEIVKAGHAISLK